MSNPFCPPNPIDLPIAPCTDALAGLRQELHAHQHRERAVRERREQLVEEAAEAVRAAAAARRRRRGAQRRARRRRATTAQPFVVVSEPRQTASTAMPDSISITMDMPGISAIRSIVVRSPNHDDASQPGTISMQREDHEHQQVVRRGWRTRRGGSASSCRFARPRLACATTRRRRYSAVPFSVHPRPSPFSTQTSGPTCVAFAVASSSSCCRVVRRAVRPRCTVPLVVLADQEDDRRLGELLEPRLRSRGASCRRRCTSGRDPRTPRRSAGGAMSL